MCTYVDLFSLEKSFIQTLFGPSGIHFVFYVGTFVGHHNGGHFLFPTGKTIMKRLLRLQNACLMVYPILSILFF
jgi:hypothetical protein